MAKPRTEAQEAAYQRRLQQNREWRARNLDKARAACDHWHQQKRDEGVKVNARYSRDAYLLLITNARKRAVQRGEVFELDHAWATEQLEKYDGRCCVTGVVLEFDRATTTRALTCPWAPSIDRIDSSIGYTRENSRLVCWAYNLAKGAWTDEIVEVWVRSMMAMK